MSAALTAAGVDFLRVPVLDTVDAWADRYRHISPGRSSMPGRWRTSRTEYARGIMRALDDPQYSKVVLKASTQVSKTEIGLCWLGRTFHQDAAPCLMVRPNITDAREFGATRLNEMIESTPVLSEIFSPLGSRTSDGAVSKADLRVFRGGQINIVGSESATGLASKPVKYLFLDEVSRFSKNSGNREGKATELAMRRLDSYEDSKTLAVSTPTDISVCQITPLYLSGTMHQYFVPCPACGYMEPYTFPRLNRDEAAMVCSSCGTLSGDDTRASAIAAGEWRSTRDSAPQDELQPLDPECFSAHLWAAYSPFVSFAEIVQRHRLAKGDRDGMREFVNLTLGEVFEDEAGQLKPAEVMEKTGTEELLHDSRILIITAGVDVQAAGWLELVVMGWDDEGRGYGIDHRQFKGSTARADGSAWVQLTQYVERFGCELEDGRQMSLDALAVDVGDNPDAPRDWILEMERTSTRTKFMPMKGSNDLTMRVSNTGKPRKIKSGDRAGRKLFWCGSQAAKNSINASLKTHPGQPGSYKFPSHIFGDAFFKGLLAEVPVSKTVNRVRRRVWENVHARRNEPLDCVVYALSARGYLSGLRQLLKTREARRVRWAASAEGQDAAHTLRKDADQRRDEIIAEAARTVPGFAPTSENEKQTAAEIVAAMPDQADDVKVELPHERDTKPKPRRRVRRRAVRRNLRPGRD